MDRIASPLVPGQSAVLVKEIARDSLIAGYQNDYGFDVSDYFAGTPKVKIFECEASGYRFFFPFELTGKESLYRHLQQFDYTHKAEKWEYDRASASIKVGSRVLDVGCGKGKFVAIAKRLGFDAHGIELNAAAAGDALKAGLSVSVEFVGEHARSRPEYYDAVCSFQVLEHISSVHDFIKDCIACLKPGGKLIFGVPNNDGFLKYADAPLNAPPHHMGLWGQRSLASVADIFGLDLKSIETEPLMEVDWYTIVMERRYLTSKLLRALYYRSGASNITKAIVARRRNSILGHTILATYAKR